MQGSLRWVVAFSSEALPIIREFGLEEMGSGACPFPLYQSPDGAVSLVLSGKGMLNAAAATAALAASVEDVPAAWINFGIAGSGLPDYGKTFLASRVADEQTKRSWYPTPCGRAKLEPERRTLTTVAKPAIEYPRDGALVEMEAAGFFPIALKCATSEFCQVVKIVSDDPDHSLSSLNRETVTELCANGLQSILPWVESLKSIIVEEQVMKRHPEGYFDLIEKFHFTETQRHQLSKLLRFWYARDNGKDSLTSMIRMCRDSRGIISSLREELYQHRL